MEELIHQFMLVTGEMNPPKGEVVSYIENPKGVARLLRPLRGRRGAVAPQDARAVAS